MTFLIVSLRRLGFVTIAAMLLLTLIFVDGHPILKHNPLHGIVLLKVRKMNN
jgi:hypothetical protein